MKTLLELASDGVKNRARALNTSTPSEIVRIVIQALEVMEESGIKVHQRLSCHGRNIGLGNCYVSIVGAMILYLNDRQCFDKGTKELYNKGHNKNIYYSVDNFLCSGYIGGFVKYITKDSEVPTAVLECNTYTLNDITMFTIWLKAVEEVLIENGL